MTVVDHRFPEIQRAFEEIDNDGGLGELILLDPLHELPDNHYIVPPSLQHLCAPAEAALARLRVRSRKDWETFLVGEQSDSEAIAKRQGDLVEAHALMEHFFNGWEGVKCSRN